jgi:GT2 family glycosyltransferase
VTAGLSVIVLQYGGGELTCAAVRSFQEHCSGPWEIIVADNASPAQADRDLLRSLSGVRLLFLERNTGFSGGNNRAAEAAAGEILLFLNNDTLTREDFVRPILAEFAADPGLGIAAPAFLNRDLTPQLSRGRLPSILQEAVDRPLYRLADRGRALGLAYARRGVRRRRLVQWVGGAALFIRRDLFRRLGGFDEGMFMYFEDKDLCARARAAGSRVLSFPAVSVIHLRGGSLSMRPSPEVRAIYRASQRRYYDRHRPWWERRLLALYQRISP